MKTTFSRRSAFIKALNHLISAHVRSDRNPENIEELEHFCHIYEVFVNNWFPVLKEEYEL